MIFLEKNKDIIRGFGQKETVGVRFCDQSDTTVLFEKIIYTKCYKRNYIKFKIGYLTL